MLLIPLGGTATFLMEHPGNMESLSRGILDCHKKGCFADPREVAVMHPHVGLSQIPKLADVSSTQHVKKKT